MRNEDRSKRLGMKRIMYARLRLFDRTALEVEGGVYLHEGGPEPGVMPGEPKEKTWRRKRGVGGCAYTQGKESAYRVDIHV